MALRYKVRLSHNEVLNYTGFAPFLRPRQLKEGRTVVIAWTDGEYELWIVEGEAGIAELKKMHMEVHGGSDYLVTRLQEVPMA